MSSVLLFFGPRAARQRASWALLLFGLFLPLFSASVRAAAATPLTSCAAPLRPGKREVIFITGGTGMIGSQLVKHALDSCVFGSDKEVVVLARWRSNLRNLKGYVHRLRLVYGDVTDPFHMINVFREVRPDYVFHFAAQAINGVSFQSASLSLHVNVQGTLNVLEAIKSLQSSGELSTDLRVLVAGSSAEYGGAAIEWEGVPIPETAMLKPFTPYGVSKVAQENLALMYASTYGIKAMVARIFIQMAEGGTDQLSLQNFAKQIAEIESRAEREDAGSRSSRSSSGKCSAAASEQSAAGSTGGISSSCGGGSMSNNYTLLHGDLSTSRDVTDVADSAPVFLELCKRGVPGEAYNLGSGVGYTIRDMLQVLLRQSASAGVERKNIRVVVRVRPPIEREIKVPGRYHQVCTADSSAKSIRLCELVPDVQEGGGMIAAKEETFAYDSVHGEGESQADVYNSTGALATEALLNGYNTTILAYGQTGTGKTYTMEGFCYDSNDERRGIIARCMDTIFHTIAEYPNRKSKFALRASYLQIYNEQIWDLLKAHQPAAGAQEKGKASSSSATAAQQVAGAIPHLRERSQERGNGTWNTPGTIGESSLIIRESKKNGLYVDGLSEWVVQTQTQVYALIQRGGQARVFADTKSNEVSSRSHTVFTIMLEHSDGEPNGLGSHTHSAAAAPDASGEPQQYNPPQYNSYGVPGAQSDGGHLVPSSAVVRMAKLNLVDLAGSERVHWTGARGQQLEESKKINTSLLALGNVIQALADVSKGNATRTHIPYRDSKLTRILEDSLGGNCITTIVAMVSPAHEAYAETLSTLKFADRAKTIKTAPSLNTFAAGGAGGSQDEKIHQIRQHYEKQVAELKEQLQLSRTGSADVLGGAGRAVLSGGNGPISGGGGYAESERSGGAAGDGMGMSRDMLFSALHEEREKSRNLERRLSQFTSGISLTKGETASCGLTSTSDRQTDIAELYEEKLTQLEAERTTIKEDKSQITR
eukprot:g8286.t1